MLSIADLKNGQKAEIIDISSESIPFKLVELGCIPGNEVEILKYSKFKDPLYLNINDTFLAIRHETASKVFVNLIEESR